jgi:two-component system LytT family response regulator
VADTLIAVRDEPSSLNGAYRIYVVEDSAILLRMLRELLGSIPDVEIVGHSERADDAIAQIVATAPDAIIVDLLLQSGTGYDVLEGVALQGKLPLSIVLTNFTMAPHPGRAARLGAAYFFDKSTEISRMLRLIAGLAKEHRRAADARKTASDA